MHSQAATIEDYIAEMEEPRRSAVATLVRLTLEASPGAEKTMDHKMPFIKLNGEPYIAVASQKQYVSFYVVKLDETLAEDVALQAAFTGVNRGKNCLRFRPSQLDNLPVQAITRLINRTFMKCA